MEWEFEITYKTKLHRIKATLIYQSKQVQRIKVFGSKGFIVLQNNFPHIVAKGSMATPIKWQLAQGELKDALLLTHIIFYLEKIIKENYQPNLSLIEEWKNMDD